MRLGAVLARPATPPAAWPLALLLALAGGAGVAYPALGVAVAALVVFAVLGASVLARPINGFVIVLWVFPFYTFTRSVIELYHLPIPLAVLGMWPELVLSVIVAGAALAAIRRRKRLPLAWDDLPVLVLLFGGLYGVLLSVVEGQYGLAVYGVHGTMSMILFYFAARWMRPTEDDLRRFLGAFLASYSVLAVLSLLDYVFRPRWVMALVAVQRTDLLMGRDPYVFFSWYPRMQSLLFGEGIWGSLSALMSLLCLTLLTDRAPARRIRERVPGFWLRALFVVSTVCMLLSLSRGAFLCWLAGLFVLLLVRGYHRGRILAAMCVLAVALLVGFWWLHDSGRGGGVTEEMLVRADALINQKNPLATDRQGQWDFALGKFALAPAGLGLGRAGAAAYTHGGQAMSDVVFDGGYFRVLVEQGVVGVLTLIAGIAGVFWVLQRHLPAARGVERAIGMTAAAYLIGLAAQNSGHNAFEFLYPTAVLWMATGLFVARRHEPEIA